ncbi:MAG: hypothetical protein ABJI04_12815, partial [Marinomonas sp.]
VDDKTGTVTETTKTADGEAKLSSSEEAPEKLPLGFTLYPGAKVTNSASFEQKGKVINMISIVSDDSPEKLTKHYRTIAEKAGITIKLEMKVNDGQMIGGDDGEGNSFSFNAQKPGGILADDEDEQIPDPSGLGFDDEGEDEAAAEPDKNAGKTTGELMLTGKFAK